MVARKDFLDAITDDSNVAFLELITKHHNRSEPFDLNEVVASLDRKQLQEVWQTLQLKTTKTLLSFTEDAEEQDEELKEASSVLRGVVDVAMASLQAETPVITPELQETAIILQGILTSLPGSERKLSTSIVRLCESWWKKELPARHLVVEQALVWLLEDTCEGKVVVADIKRVWAFRECLLLIDIETANNAPLKALLLTAMMSPNYLKGDEGRRFLAFLLTLKESFVEELHKTIKNQLPLAKRTVLTHYGEVYFKAWRAAEGPVKEKIEQYCIQDLMYHAIHAQRGSSRSLSSCLRVVLGYLHKQKKHPGVDQLLVRLYGPILWRSLKVANAHVRANAAALLVDAFPLRDPDARTEEEDTLHQQQIDALQTLLYDPSSTVRAVVVTGVCRILVNFWEVMPAATIQWMLGRLTRDLAWDAASPEVRVAVLKGLGEVLDNHLSHPMLKLLLPDLRNLLHDSAESVRVAFLDLLLKVKGIRTIKFWSIAPMEHLLARLEGDASVVSRRIISLIFYSFMPTDKPVDLQLARCISLIQTNPGAARWFYRYMHEKVPLLDTVKFMTAICRCVLTCVRRESGESGDGADMPRHSTDDTGEQAEEEEEDEDAEEAEKENITEDGDDLSLSDTNLMAGLFETVVILWEGIRTRLQKPSNADIHERLQLRFSQSLPEFYRAFSDPRVCASLTLLAGFLPPNNIPSFSRSMLAKLRSMPDDCDTHMYSSMLESMCKWGKAGDVIRLVLEWLQNTLVMDNQEDSLSLNSSRKKRGVKFAEPVVPRPRLALLYTHYLIRSTICQEVLLDSHRALLADLTHTLQNVLNCIEQRLRSTEPLSEHATDEFLLEAFDLYCRLEILLHNPEDKEHNAFTAMEHLLMWAEGELLPFLRHRRAARRRLLNQTEMTLLTDPTDADATLSTTLNMTLSTTMGGSKRTVGDAHTPAIIEMTSKLIRSLLSIINNMLLVGVGDQELLSQLANFMEALLKTDESVNFVEQLSTLLYQVTELSSSWGDVGQAGDTDDEGVGSHVDVVPGMLSKVFQLLMTLTKTKKEQAARILPTIKPAVSQILFSYYRHHTLNNTVNQDIMGTIMAAVLAEMTETVAKDPDMECCDKVANLPLLTSFILSAIGRKKTVNSLFLGELCACMQSGAADNLENQLAALHLVHTISRSSPHTGELKDCLTAVQSRLESLVLPEDLSEDSPYRAMHTTTKKLLKDCMDHVGMVA